MTTDGKNEHPDSAVNPVSRIERRANEAVALPPTSQFDRIMFEKDKKPMMARPGELYHPVGTTVKIKNSISAKAFPDMPSQARHHGGVGVVTQHGRGADDKLVHYVRVHDSPHHAAGEEPRMGMGWVHPEVLAHHEDLEPHNESISSNNESAG